MADLKLFQISNHTGKIKKPKPISLEKEIQTLCENNLEEFFNIRLLASEYNTGVKHGGRIDTLGIDENHTPVIIEYKLHSNENVINQGLYYLDWLVDHKANFEMLFIEKYNEKVDIDWENPRLICIAKDFTKYDDYAIGQINKNIELIRYRMFEDELLVLEVASSTSQQVDRKGKTATNYKGVTEYIKDLDDELKALFDEVDEYIQSLGDDVQKKELKYYIAYRRLRNFVCLEVYPKSHALSLYLKIPPDQVESDFERIRDVSEIGHRGTGDTEVSISNKSEFNKVKDLILQSYELS